MQTIKHLFTSTLLIMLIASLGGCQWGARQFGGDITIDVPCDQKIFDVTWKNANIWFATHPMGDDEEPEVTTFTESSVLGAAEGTVTFIESRCK